jgi:ketosteroid isomerase-like protein
VADTERAFADTLARRDLDGFRRFLAPDAVFVDDATTLRGPDAIVAAWQDLFKAPQAPFSWRPDRVEVQADGVLALSTGPVSNAAGHVVGRFTSTWREATPGVWRIVLDIGSPACSTAPR